MRKIIASLDIGSSLIKLVVGELVRNKVHILACVDTPSRGIKNGYVINNESAIESFKEVFAKVEAILGLPVKKVIATIPCTYAECFLSTGTVAVTKEDKTISNQDIIKAMQKCIYKKISENKELVTVLPTSFEVNGEVVSNPINMTAEKLKMKSIVITVPKKNIEGIASCLKAIDVELVDIVISPLGDYYEHNNKELNKLLGAVVNIGEDITTVSIFNKGILTNLEVMDIGGKNISNDLSYVYKINEKDAKYVKEHLALSHTRLAQPNESMSFTDKHGENVKINQYDASEIVMMRITEIINLAKKQINLLTKKEISYIILTGGVTESEDFSILASELLGDYCHLEKVEEIGARNNKYGTAIGMIKYYGSRLKLRNVDFSIFNKEEQEELCGSDNKTSVSDESVLGKLFGYFFDN